MVIKHLEDKKHEGEGVDEGMIHITLLHASELGCERHGTTCTPLSDASRPGCWLAISSYEKIEWLYTKRKGISFQSGSLSQGEYVAPDKIEDVYSRSRFISQVFVYGDSLENFLVAIVLLDDDYIKT